MSGRRNESGYCYKCDRQFKNAHGLSVHEAKMHRDKSNLHIPEDWKGERNKSLHYYRQVKSAHGMSINEPRIHQGELSHYPSKEEWRETDYPYGYAGDLKNPHGSTSEAARHRNALSPTSPCYGPLEGERTGSLHQPRQVKSAHGLRIQREELSHYPSKGDLEELYQSTWNDKKDKSRSFSHINGGSRAPAQAASKLYVRHLERMKKIVQDEIGRIPDVVRGRRGLEKAFTECAKVHFIYCDVVETLDSSKKHWVQFLDTVCELYDNLLAWNELHFWPNETDRKDVQTSLRSHRAASGSCTICPSFDAIRGDFKDDRDHKCRKYKLHDFPGEVKYYCKVQNVIYLITCKGDGGKCTKRYVGKTKNSLRERYPSGSKKRECAHFAEAGHGENFRILQIVDEASLFPNNESFVGYVRENPANTRGVEKLWIDRLIGGNDLNRQKEFNRGDDHRRHMSELLRYFICKHEIKYVVANTKRPDTSHRAQLNRW